MLEKIPFKMHYNFFKKYIYIGKLKLDSGNWHQISLVLNCLISPKRHIFKNEGSTYSFVISEWSTMYSNGRASSTES